ncbi:glycosyltransferase [Flavobacterium cucumis]|uniref:Glycosyltransferase involved in cell wall bisynthesis n=2 Tax=Flavobacterium cucumis TaxID=416016 RepID=A0A1M7ZXE0_9FLAO|nr:glycosyltransferase [Flavobacterium cucumis]SHO73297.1 Glycosyltransferase involved in cell wall bisynthesis [Flavobacterium cucumis]
MKGNNVCVVTAQKFPSGLASNNRILSYSKGLKELDYNVDVLTLAYSSDRRGIISGVKYFNLGANLRFKIFTILFGILKVCIKILKNKYDFLILVSNNAFLISLLFLVCKIKNITYIQEKSEFPFVLNYRGFLKKKIADFYINYIYRLFDGMIVMTQPLLEYFKGKTNKKCKMFLMPMTVDVDRFKNVDRTDEYSNCITYCGYMGGNKDGVKNLIEAFSLIQEQHPSIQLLLLGTATDSEFKEIVDYANAIAPNRVIFKGQVSRDEIPFYLVNSKILALARPSSLQSSGGFPTKLGEYLSTKKPVIVTAVGDIPKYLKSRENAFLVAPDDNSLFANELSYMLNNYDKALAIATKGYDLTLSVFNYRQQSVNLRAFLKAFKK